MKNNKRYHTYDYYLIQKYGVKTAKIALNAGFSCPHISKTGRSCIYCGEKYHNTVHDLLSPEEIVKQFGEKKEALSKKWRDTKYIAYFQVGSNTFAAPEELKKIYESVLAGRDDPGAPPELKNLAGIDIATRPDCITREIAEYLAKLSQKTDVTIELGLQTCHDATAEFINRGYKLKVFEEAYRLLAEYKIPAAVHIINGLPGETPEMMLETAKYLAGLDPLPLGVKIHMLYIEPGTEIYDMYDSGQIKLLSKEEYIDIVVPQLEILPSQIVIMRLTGDPAAARSFRSANPATIPCWAAKKFAVINDIDKELLRRGTWQGARVVGEKPPFERGWQHGVLTGVCVPRAASDFANPRPAGTPFQKGAYGKSLTNILSFAKRLLDISIKENGVYADFTMGNGNDTLYIKKMCPTGKIYAFDIQAGALEITKKKLEGENCLDENIYLIHDSHANFKKYIPPETGLDGAIFNLGYLPGGDKSVTTQTSSTLACLTDALEMLADGGVIVVCVYPGHGEGAREGEKILGFAGGLDKKRFDCLYHRLINIPDAPFVIAFQKKP